MEPGREPAEERAVSRREHAAVETTRACDSEGLEGHSAARDSAEKDRTQMLEWRAPQATARRGVR